MDDFSFFFLLLTSVTTLLLGSSSSYALFFTQLFLQRQLVGFSAMSLTCQFPETHITVMPKIQQ